MTNRTAASRYARALADVLVAEKGDFAQVDRDLAAFVALFAAHPQLAKVLTNPAVPVPRKQAAVAELTARQNTSPVLAKLLGVLAGRERLNLLADILVFYRERVLDLQNIVRAELTTATPLSADRAQAFEQSLARITGRTVTLATNVDPSIIGGVVARVGSTVYDGSVTTTLAKLKQKLVENV